MHNDDTNDDESLFLQEMSNTRKLAQDKQEPWKKRRKPVPLNIKTPDEENELHDLNIETPEFLSFMRPGIQNRVFNELKNGQIEPDTTLDLHGLRVEEARGVMANYLHDAIHYEWRCIHIIHGKGLGSSHQPILKQKVHQWLQQREEVMAFCSCPQWDGGSGAVYALLSKKRLKQKRN